MSDGFLYVFAMLSGLLIFLVLAGLSLSGLSRPAALLLSAVVGVGVMTGLILYGLAPPS